MKRLLTILVLLSVSAGMYAVDVITTVNAVVGQSTPFINQVTQSACSATETQITINTKASYNVTIQFQASVPWNYTSTTGASTTQFPVAANTPITLRFIGTVSNFYVTSTGSGTLYILPLSYSFSPN